VSSKPNARRVTKWKSMLGAATCPYENRLRLARWFFYHRHAAALEAAGPKPGARVVDIGCWEGHFLPSLVDNYGEVWGVENDAASLIERLPSRWTILQAARELCAAEGIWPGRLYLTKTDARLLPFAGESFDIAFCLDSLPYTAKQHRPAVVGEIRRILKTGGRAVFTLPVEIGPAVLIRELIRKLSGTWSDGYTFSELMCAMAFRPAATRPNTNLIGYDYREDLRVIASGFSIDRVQFLPWNSTRWASPTVLVRCSR
jgi:SAM-dependent methyltransferase